MYGFQCLLRIEEVNRRWKASKTSLEGSILMAFPCFVFEVRHEGLMGGGFQLNDFKSVAFSASSGVSTTAFISVSLLKAMNRKKLKQSNQFDSEAYIPGYQ